MGACTGIVGLFKHLLHVRAHPQFFGLELSAPVARDNMVVEGYNAVDSRQNPSLLKVHLKCSKDRPATTKGWYLHQKDQGQYLPSRCRTVLPCHLRSEGQGTLYWNWSQHSSSLGLLVQTLWDAASALAPRLLWQSVGLKTWPLKLWGDGTDAPFWRT